MADTTALQEPCVEHASIPLTRKGKPHSKPWLIPYQWTPERARELQAKATASKAKNKALRAALAQSCEDPEAIRLEQVRIIRGKLKRKGITAAEYAGWMRNLRDLGGLPPRKEDRPAPTQSKQGPVQPIV